MAASAASIEAAPRKHWTVHDYLRTRREAKGFAIGEVEEAVIIAGRRLSAPLADLESGTPPVTMADGRALARALGVDFHIVMAIGVKGTAAVCDGCGCSWEDACQPPCAWADDTQRICTSCKARAAA